MKRVGKRTYKAGVGAARQLRAQELGRGEVWTLPVLSEDRTELGPEGWTVCQEDKMRVGRNRSHL